MPQSSDYTAEKLALMARAGEDDALVQLIHMYAPLVKSRARVYAGIGMEPDDLTQEGMIGLISAIRVYDEKQSSFSTFARLCIDRMLTSAARQAGRQKRIPKDSLVPIDRADERSSEALLQSGEESNPEAILIAREDAQRLRRRAGRMLSGFEYQVFFYYLSGESYEEIARHLKTTNKAIDNALQRIRRKLRDS